jgi:hypothetical protein
LRIRLISLGSFSLDGTKAIATGQITLPALDISTLAHVPSICYHATLLREEGVP